MSKITITTLMKENAPLSRMEEILLLDRLISFGGNKTRTAASLGIGLRTLQRKIKQFPEELHPTRLSAGQIHFASSCLAQYLRSTGRPARIPRQPVNG